MKFDPFSYDEVKTNVENESRKGKLRLFLSAPSALYVAAQGYEALAGYGASFDLEITEAFTFRIEAAKGVRAFRLNPAPASYVAAGEVYTNADRMPHESGSMAEVTRARRMLEIERRSMMADMRAEFASMRQKALNENPAPDPVETEETEETEEGAEE